MLAGESIEEWLKIKGFKVWWGSSRRVVGPYFLFFDAADRMAIGEKIVLSGKSILSRKSQGFP